ncbi:MAG: hypothetical protein QNJ37_21920 [Crocosphaera sp.]|nr:hypothetical protein [Crocosphaera sp.]
MKHIDSPQHVQASPTSGKNRTSQESINISYRDRDIIFSSDLSGFDLKIYLFLLSEDNPSSSELVTDEAFKAIAKLSSFDLLPDWFTKKYLPYSKSRDWTMIINRGGLDSDLITCVDQLYDSLTSEDSLLKEIESIPVNKNEFIKNILNTGLWKGNNCFIWSHDHPEFEPCMFPPGWSQKYNIVPTFITRR